QRRGREALETDRRCAAPGRSRAGPLRRLAVSGSGTARRPECAAHCRRFLVIRAHALESRAAAADGDASCASAGRGRGARKGIITGSLAAAFPLPHRAIPTETMTTLVAVRKNDEIAIAADSLTTFGDTRLSADYDRTSEKIVHYKGNYIGLCGSAAHQLVFESLLAAHGDLDFSNKLAIFETFRKLHPILKEQHFLNPKEEEDDPYESTQVTALVANEHGIFGVYSMREVFEYSRYWSVGSGRE